MRMFKEKLMGVLDLKANYSFVIVFFIFCSLNVFYFL